MMSEEQDMRILYLQWDLLETLTVTDSENVKYIKQNITLQPSNLCSTWSKVVSISAQHSLQKLLKHFHESCYIQ